MRKFPLILSLSVGVLSAVLVAEAANKPGYVVEPSAIVPQWSGAEPGVWTMDLDAALSRARADGKWTIVMFSGMWWCPYCQPLEEKVLNTPGWANFVSSLGGAYEVALDFPYRDGVSNFCWLWDPGYVKSCGLTTEEAQAEVGRRYRLQTEYSTVGSQVQQAVNIVGTETNEVTYVRVGYPTMILIRPSGIEAGRFSPAVRGDGISQERALQIVTDSIREIMADEASVGGVGYPTVRAAVAAAADGATVSLLKNVVSYEEIVVSGKRIIFEPCGFSLSAFAGTTHAVSNLVCVTDGGALEIRATDERISGHFKVAAGGTLLIGGGCYSEDVSNFVAEGLEAVRSGDWWVVREKWAPHPPADSYSFVVGKGIEPIPLLPTNVDATVTAKGLPKGVVLKRDGKTKAYTLSGKPSQEQSVECVFVAKSAVDGVASNTVSFVVRMPRVEAVAVGDTFGSRITGAGGYKCGATAKLKATAARAKAATKTSTAVPATVFCGWFRDAACTVPACPNYLADTLTYVLKEDDAVEPARFHARFLQVSSEEAQALEIDAGGDFHVLSPTVSTNLPLRVRSTSRYVVKAANLPAGLKLVQSSSDKTYEIAGKPTKPGELQQPVTLTVSNLANAKGIVRTIRILVDNFTSPAFPGLAPTYDSFVAGVSNAVMIADAVGASSVSGLPSGLKFNAREGLVFGTAGKPGKFLVKFKKGKELASALFVVYQGKGFDPMHPGEIADGIAIVPSLASAPLWDGRSRVTVYAGVSQRFQLAVSGLDGVLTTVTAKGVPAGMKFIKEPVRDAKGSILGYSYSIEGVPTQRQAAKPVLLSGKNKYGWTGSAGFELEVRDLPPWATGSFDGVCILQGKAAGSVTMSVSTSGRVSGKVCTGGKSYSFSSASLASYEADSDAFLVDAKVSSATGPFGGSLRLKIGCAESTVGTVLSQPGGLEAALHLVQNAWKRSDLVLPKFPPGYKLKLGESLTLVFGSTGAVTVSGKISGDDGRLVAVSGKAQVLTGFYDSESGINAELVLYFGPKNGLSVGFVQVLQLIVSASADGRVVTGVTVADMDERSL